MQRAKNKQEREAESIDEFPDTESFESQRRKQAEENAICDASDGKGCAFDEDFHVGVKWNLREDITHFRAERDDGGESIHENGLRWR